MPLEPVERKSLSDAVFDQLSAEIVSGALEPGETLPAERELCRVLGVNRGAVREAIKRLVQAGLVTVRHGGGATVNDYRSSGSLDLLSHLLFERDGTVNLRVARSVMEMRAALAPDLARLCAERATDEVLTKLDELVASMESHPEDVPALQVDNIELWAILAEGSDNVAYQLAYNTLRATYEQIRDVLVHALADEVSNIGAVRKIIKAVRKHDGPAAARATTALLRPGTEGVLAVLAALEEEHAKQA